MPPVANWPTRCVKPGGSASVYKLVWPHIGLPKSSNMKKSIVSMIGLILLFIGSSYAQQTPGRPDGPPPPPPHQRKGGQNRLPLKALKLSDAQKESFKKQRTEFKQRMDALKKEEDITVKEWKSRMEKLRKENQTAMQNILTPDQKEQLKKMREEAGQKQLQGMKERLNLTEDQTAQLKKQRSATQKQLKAIRENENISTEQKKEAVKKLMKVQKESMEKLLTEEQKKKWKAMRSNGPKAPGHRPGMPPPPSGQKESLKQPKQEI